jgi:DNA-binding MarR family transcriptional regulator
MRIVGAYLPHPEVRAQRASKDAPQDEAGQIVMKAEILALESFLPYRLNRIAEAISREFSKIYRDRFGLTRPEWRTLATLGEFGTMTATAIGEHSSMHKTKVSRAVAELESRKWLTRTPHAADRRVEHLALTKAGRSAYGELVPLAKAFELNLLGKLTDGDRQALLHGLGAVEAVSTNARSPGVEDHESARRAVEQVRELKRTGRKTGITVEEILSARDEGRK